MTPYDSRKALRRAWRADDMKDDEQTEGFQEKILGCKICKEFCQGVTGTNLEGFHLTHSLCDQG